MRKKDSNTKKRLRKPRGSLLSPQMVGGIIAGEGFDFQTRYAACHLPIWLLDGSFHQLFFEGTGDIDVRFSAAGHSSRIHIQVKDHEVTPSEFKSVLDHFRSLDSDLPGVYKRFALACPSLAATLRPVEAGLARLRGASPFYDDAPGALAPTKQEVDERLRKGGLSNYIDFIHGKVFIDVGHGDLRHDDRAVELFIARMLSHPEYSGKIRAMVQPAFAELMRAIGANKGVTLERSQIEEILRSAVTTADHHEKAITIWLQNWTNETFDPPADYSLDWSAHFDRNSRPRRVPSSKTWDAELVPQLIQLKNGILAERTDRKIRFRGKSALSTGIALGSVFPTVGGWTFEIPQPPSKTDWRSDATVTPDYELKVEIANGSLHGADVVLGLNIKGDGRQDVLDYVESSGEQPRLFAFMSPVSQGGQAIAGSDDAVAFAHAVREQLGHLLKKHHLHRTRLFFYGPFALSVFLGQQLTSVGEVQLFEYQDPGYVPSCKLST